MALRLARRRARPLEVEHNTQPFKRNWIVFGVFAEFYSRSALIDRNRRGDAVLCQVLFDQNCPCDVLCAGGSAEGGERATCNELVESHRADASESSSSIA